MVLPKLPFATLILLLSRYANAFPSGAGGCLGGEAAVGGGHLASSNIVTGSLKDARIRFELDGDELLEDGPLYVRVNKSTPLVMTAPYSGSGIKGFLIRLSSSDMATSDYDLTGALTLPIVPEEQRAYIETKVVGSLCEDSGAAGLTHINANPKYLIGGELLFTQDITNDLLLDVTAVMENSASKSEYYYSQFRIKVKSFTEAPTAAPGTKFITWGDHPISAAASLWLSFPASTPASFLTGLAVAVGGWLWAGVL
jgi:hypothetical protein